METLYEVEKKVFKYSKECYLKIRNEIKTLSSEQTMVKNQRKEDKNLKTARVYTQIEAVKKADENTKNLRILFILYDEVRGKEEMMKACEKALPDYLKKKLELMRDEYLRETKVI